MSERRTTVPTQDEVNAAARRIQPFVLPTPLLRSDALDQIAGASLFFKAECLQITGSFKIRGATNRLVRIQEELGGRDVVAFSSGNHAQGVARAARWLGLKATIVMPSSAPKVKVQGVEADGATIRLYDPETESREALAHEIAEQSGAIVVPSFDDPDIISGQGTVGLELLDQTQAMNVTLDDVICCAGGGGLVTGIALALSQTDTVIWTAEPQGHDDWARSISSGKQVSNAPGVRSICDAILTPTPGNIPWQIGQSRLNGGYTVSDEQVLQAMKLAFRHLKIVLEPGGAVALASALFAHKPTSSNDRIGVVLSGGNVDAPVFERALRTSFP